MSLDTYANLQTEIANYLNRSDLTAQIPGFIQLAESKINRELRLREQEQLAYTTYQTTATNTFLALPSGFIEFLSLKYRLDSETDDNYEEIKFLPPSKIHQAYHSGTGKPEYYTMRDQLELNVLPNADYRIRMHYYKKWDLATDSTNWLLTNHPDAYLFGALANSETYIYNDARLPTWVSAWQEALDKLNERDERSRDMTTMDVSEFNHPRFRDHYYILTD